MKRASLCGCRLYIATKRIDGSISPADRLLVADVKRDIGIKTVVMSGLRRPGRRLVK